VSRYLLDTDTAIEIISGTQRPRRLGARSQSQAGCRSLGCHRCGNGVRRASQHGPGGSLELLTRFCSAFEILPLTRAGAVIAGRARAHLETAGQRIGPHDVLIAGVALAEARVLVTHNTREFMRVPDLKFEDWLV
jgi:tRNA(fMet)-specific endonuclease VapC